jgi:hypothetical protein
MRALTNRAKLQAFMAALGEQAAGPGRIYLAGGATAVLHGWRDTTIDIDLKPDPEPRAGLVRRELLPEMFTLIKPQLIRYPAVDPASFEAALLEFCKATP